MNAVLQLINEVLSIQHPNKPVYSKKNKISSTDFKRQCNDFK